MQASPNSKTSQTFNLNSKHHKHPMQIQTPVSVARCPSTCLMSDQTCTRQVDTKVHPLRPRPVSTLPCHRRPKSEKLGKHDLPAVGGKPQGIRWREGQGSGVVVQGRSAGAQLRPFGVSQGCHAKRSEVTLRLVLVPASAAFLDIVVASAK